MKNNFKTLEIKRGDVVVADFSPVEGSEQGGVRPAVVISNDTGNKFSSTIIVALISSKVKKMNPTHTQVKGTNLHTESIVLCEQLRTIDKKRIRQQIGKLKASEMIEVDKKIKLSLGIW